MGSSLAKSVRRWLRIAAPLWVFVLTSGPSLRAGATRADDAPPIVLVSSADSRGERLEVRARIVDPSGPGLVLLHVRGPRDETYRTIPMEAISADTFVAGVPFSGGPEDWLLYYVEATDRYGNGPGLGGSAEEPFQAVPMTAEETNRGGGAWIGLLLLGPALLLLVLLIHQPGRRRREEEFWIELLAPVSRERGLDLERAIAELCSVRHRHPERGEVSIDPERALGQLRQLRARRAEELETAFQEHQQRARKSAEESRSLVAATEEQIRDELFWFHMLRPLIGATNTEVDQGLGRLAARRHFHPEQGWRIFDARALRNHLDRVRSVDPRELFEVARHLESLPRPTAVGSDGESGSGCAGASLIELTVVLALLAAVVGITALGLRSMENPVQTGGELLGGLLSQARAGAISRTSVHRVRPVDTGSLIVESSSRCSSVAWSLEQKMSLELPRDVTLSDTAWSVCFDSRGIASDNVVLTLNHPEHAPRQLELLRGGTMRWLP